MRTVSFQGTQLTPGQKVRLQQQLHIRSFMNPVLQTSVDETIKLLDKRKEEGAKPERQWFLDFQSSGTPSIAEFMGY